MISATLKKLYHERWVAAILLAVFCIGVGWFSYNKNQQAIAASRDAKSASEQAVAAATAAAIASEDAAEAARLAHTAPCKAIVKVANVLDPVTAALKRLIDRGLQDRNNAIYRADLAIKQATTPTAKAAAILAKKQLTASFADLDAISKAAENVGPLSC